MQPILFKVVQHNDMLWGDFRCAMWNHENGTSLRGEDGCCQRTLGRDECQNVGQVKADGHVTREVAVQALDMLGVDALGLDELDRRFLRAIAQFYDGGPVGIEALAATLNEDRDTLEDVVEPYMLRIGLLNRTSKGRRVTKAAFEHLGLDFPKSAQKDLF